MIAEWTGYYSCFYFNRGESNGTTGIFPSDFVEIIESSDVPSPSATLSQQTSAALELFSPTGSFAYPESNYTTDGPGTTVASTEVPYDVSAGQLVSNDNIFEAGDQVPQAAPSSNPPATLSKTSAHWKTIDATEDMDLLDDDYFKKNMPGLFSSSNPVKSTVENPNDTQMIIPPYSQASASESFSQLKPRYENVLSSLTSENDSLNTFSKSSDSYFMGKRSPCAESVGEKHRYDNVNEDPFTRAKSLQHESALLINTHGCVNDHQSSALTQAQNDQCGDRGGEIINSLSQKVEDYFSQNSFSDNQDSVVTNNNLRNNLIKQYSSLSSPGYNEDNTGIEPYGRAVFSFKAQYPNELTFKKGDIIHLLKHIDSHWTLGRIGNCKGIFPTSYVDIIVNCLHNEEETFLARPENLMQAFLGYAKAEYSFEGVQAGDVSMSKGDILKVVNYVDDNWVIVENLNGSKGMCPQNYLSMLFELNSKPQENTVQESLSEESSKRESRQLVQNTTASRSRSTSPYNTSGSRRSYSRDDFGSIKQQAVDSVLAKNIASLDVACKNTCPEKRASESVFTEREVCEQKNSEVTPPVIPPRISRTLSGSDGKSKGTTRVVDSKKPNVAENKKPTVISRTTCVPPVPPRVSLGKVSDEKNDTPAPEISGKVSLPKPAAEPNYTKIHKPQSSKRSSSKVLQLCLSKKDGMSGGAQLTRGDSASSASFPDDVSTVSLSSEGTYSSGETIRVSFLLFFKET